MIAILLIALTWYITKLYYTRDMLIHFPELDEYGLMTAQCVQCSQYIVISQEHMRNPFYCMACR